MALCRGVYPIEFDPKQLDTLQPSREALDCLVRINTERFGSKDEIAAAMRDLANWLRRHSAHIASVKDPSEDSPRSVRCAHEADACGY